MMHGKQHGDSWTQDRRGMDGVTVETKAAGNVSTVGFRGVRPGTGAHCHCQQASQGQRTRTPGSLSNR
jgi:hypothetical protein